MGTDGPRAVSLKVEGSKSKWWFYKGQQNTGSELEIGWDLHSDDWEPYLQITSKPKRWGRPSVLRIYLDTAEEVARFNEAAMALVKYASTLRSKEDGSHNDH